MHNSAAFHTRPASPAGAARHMARHIGTRGVNNSRSSPRARSPTVAAQRAATLLRVLFQPRLQPAAAAVSSPAATATTSPPAAATGRGRLVAAHRRAVGPGARRAIVPHVPAPGASTTKSRLKRTMWRPALRCAALPCLPQKSPKPGRRLACLDMHSRVHANASAISSQHASTGPASPNAGTFSTHKLSPLLSGLCPAHLSSGRRSSSRRSRSSPPRPKLGRQAPPGRSSLSRDGASSSRGRLGRQALPGRSPRGGERSRGGPPAAGAGSLRCGGSGGGSSPSAAKQRQQRRSMLDAVLSSNSAPNRHACPLAQPPTSTTCPHLIQPHTRLHHPPAGRTWPARAPRAAPRAAPRRAGGVAQTCRRQRTRRAARRPPPHDPRAPGPQSRPRAAAASPPAPPACAAAPRPAGGWAGGLVGGA